MQNTSHYILYFGLQTDNWAVTQGDGVGGGQALP